MECQDIERLNIRVTDIHDINNSRTYYDAYIISNIQYFMLWVLSAELSIINVLSHYYYI